MRTTQKGLLALAAFAFFFTGCFDTADQTSSAQRAFGGIPAKQIFYKNDYSIYVSGPVNFDLDNSKPVAGSKCMYQIGGFSDTRAVGFYYGVNSPEKWTFAGPMTMKYDGARGTNYGEIIIDIPANANTFIFKFVMPWGEEITSDGKGFPLITDVIKRAAHYEYASLDGNVKIYYAGTVNNSVKCHIGKNDWKDVKDMPMTYNISMLCWELDFVPDTDAATYEFCFTDGTNWDSNDGWNWKLNLLPWVGCSTVNGVSTITYTGNFDQVSAHIGFNGWKTVIADKLMTKTGDRSFTLSVTAPADAIEINICFTDARGHWQNNFGQNWNYSLK